MDGDLDNALPLLAVEDLSVEFFADAGPVSALDGVSLTVRRGQTVAIVGESGCGKSVTALSIMRLLPRPAGKITSGRILFTQTASDEGGGGSDLQRSPPRHPQGVALPGDSLQQDLLTLSTREMCRIRGNRIAMIFQEPFASLNPVYTVGAQIVEAIELHRALRGKAARAVAVEMMHQVGIPDPAERFRDYPHQMSGGMLQRVMIAMALSCRPSLLIADEPTTALDVTTQSQILELLGTLQERAQMGVIIITHDLGVVAQIADYVYVMYAGRIVEHAPTDALFAEPLHPYTQGLMRCMPRLAGKKTRLDVIPGSVPDPTCFPPGCRFHPRCRRSTEQARASGRASIVVESNLGGPVLRRCIEHYDAEPSGIPALSELGPGHFVACWEASAP